MELDIETKVIQLVLYILVTTCNQVPGSSTPVGSRLLSSLATLLSKFSFSSLFLCFFTIFYFCFLGLSSLFLPILPPLSAFIFCLLPCSFPSLLFFIVLLHSP